MTTASAPLGRQAARRAIEQSGTRPPPVSLDRFELCDLLGAGGMGRVYRAQDRDMGAEVALKTLHHLTSDEVLQLKTEFRSLSGITHENLVQLFELFVDGDNCFFSLELVRGVSLRQFVFGQGSCKAGLGSGVWERLVRVVEQLCAGLQHLHACGKLHRDLKPPNVLVTPAGRVVILDFGLVTGWDSASKSGLEAPGFAGTLLYMAPEQAWGVPLSPAVDWYGLGVLLYELLTDELPFDGTPMECLTQKQACDTRPPRLLNPEIPERINDMILGLLSSEPKTRFSGADVLMAFQIEQEAPGSLVGVIRERFVGRAAELERLESILNQPVTDGAVLVTVSGESGMGKTELLRRFCDIQESQGALVLRARCYPHESVAYKAFDAAFDVVSRYLEQIDEEELIPLRPRRVRALLKLFPVLQRIAAFTETAPIDTMTEPREQRRQGFVAACELLWRLGQYQKVLLWVDDVQWGDDDSYALLREMLAANVMPGCWLVMSHRAEQGSPFLQALRAGTAHLPNHRYQHIDVGPMAEHELTRLASGLHPKASEAVLQALVSESGGSPFFAAELARQAERRGGYSPNGSSDVASPGPSLAALLGARLARLQPGEQRLLRVVSVAGGPIERSLALDAADLGEGGRVEAHRLEAYSLLRLNDVDGRAAMETYHDRIRESLLSTLAPAELRACHGRLAHALSSRPAPDPQVLMTHWLGAGKRKDAAICALEAATRAMEALAFRRAATLYGTALSLGESGAAKRDLLVLRGRALTGAGQGGEAAEAFAEAAQLFAVEPGGQRTLELQLAAAEQYLRSGRTDEGAALMKDSLRRVGVFFPRSPGAAARRGALGRLGMILNGLRVDADAGEPLLAEPFAVETAAETRRRLDALWTATTSFSMMTPVVADAFGVQHLTEALRTGDPSRAVRALGYEAVCEASVGGAWFERRSRKIVDVARALAARTQDPYDLAWVRLAEGCCAWCRCEYAKAIKECDAASKTFREHCRGVAWELATADLFSVSALAITGDLKRLDERLPILLADAVERDDLFAANNFRLGQASVLWLAQDRPAYAKSLTAEALRTWPKESYHLQHYTYLLAQTQAELYLGNTAVALDLVESEWPRLVSGQILRLQNARAEMLHLRGRVALAHAVALSNGKARRTLIKRAQEQAKLLAKSSVPSAGIFAALLRAGVQRALGNSPLARNALRVAQEACQARGLRLYQHAAGYALDRNHTAQLTELGVVRPGRLGNMLIPGFSLDDSLAN